MAILLDEAEGVLLDESGAMLFDEDGYIAPIQDPPTSSSGRTRRGGAVRHTGKVSRTRARPTKTIRITYDEISPEAALVRFDQVDVIDRLLKLAASLPPLWAPTPALLPLPCTDDELVLLLC